MTVRAVKHLPISENTCAPLAFARHIWRCRSAFTLRHGAGGSGRRARNRSATHHRAGKARIEQQQHPLQHLAWLGGGMFNTPCPILKKQHTCTPYLPRAAYWLHEWVVTVSSLPLYLVPAVTPTPAPATCPPPAPPQAPACRARGGQGHTPPAIATSPPQTCTHIETH